VKIELSGSVLLRSATAEERNLLTEDTAQAEAAKSKVGRSEAGGLCRKDRCCITVFRRRPKLLAECWRE
jgi:hypothetical protein